LSSFANTPAGDAIPTTPARVSGYSQGHRVYVQGSYTRSYFRLRATTVSAFWELKPAFQNFASNASYVFSGDMNGDGYSGND